MGLSDKYDLFIFDWDGTLTNMKLIHKLNETLNPFWLKRKKESKEKALIDKKELKLDEIAEQKELKRYKRIIDILMTITMPILQDGTINGLKTLKKKGKKVALFSNGANWRIAYEAKSLKVYKYFDYLLSAQSVGYIKPNPIGLKVIMERFGANSKRTLYIGDMIDDIVTARLAGIDCCAVSCGLDSYYSLKSERPKYLFNDMEEFYRKL